MSTNYYEAFTGEHIGKHSTASDGPIFILAHSIANVVPLRGLLSLASSDYTIIDEYGRTYCMKEFVRKLGHCRIVLSSSED